MSQGLAMGKIRKPHGISGWVVVESYTQDPLALFSLPLWKDEYLSTSVHLRPIKQLHTPDLWVATVQGVTTRTQAESLRHMVLWTSREALPPVPEGTYYYSDLIGLHVKDEQGALRGKVTHIDDFGACPLLFIEKADGTSFYVTLTEESISQVCIEEGWISIFSQAMT